jgi:hypothetical protein
MSRDFRIRYRAHHTDGSGGALVVEDPQGLLYLFSGGQLQLRLDPSTGWQRVNTYLLRAHYTWQRVEDDELHPLETLPALERPPGGGVSPSAA